MKGIKKGLVVLFVLVLSLTLAACGSNANGGSNASNNANTGSKDAGNQGNGKTETVSINVLTQSIEPEELLAKFREVHPEIEVIWEQVDTDNISQAIKTRLAAGGESLDLFSPQKVDYVSLANSGKLLDISGASFLENYDEQAINSAKVDDKVYGIPLTQQAYLVWYNKDIFEENQLSEPTSWEEFLAVSETLKSNGIAPIVLAGKDDWIVNVFAGLPYSGLFSQEPSWLTEVAAGEVKWTDDGSIESLNKLKTLVDNGYLLEGALGTGYDQAYQAFYQGQAAMMVNGAWSIDLIINSTPEFEVGAFVPPGNNEGEPLKVAFTPGNTISIASDSKHPEEAQTLLDFLSQPENASIFAKTIKQFSSVKGSTADFHPATKLLEPIFATDKTDMLHAVLSPSVNSILGKELQKLISGEANAEQVAEALQKAQDKDL